MKSLMLFVEEVLKDLGTWCCTSTSRDYKTVATRVEHEGLSFLTITLTDFGRDFEKSLDQGHVGHDLFKSFSRSGGLPRFLGGFLDHVFDRGSGRLVDDPCITCIHSIRQFTLMFGKINLPCTKTRETKAIQGFIDCEKEVRSSDKRLSSQDREDFHRISRMLFADMFSNIDLAIYNGDILPKHGPGSVADKHKGNSKWKSVDWTERLEKIFPSGEYLLPSWRFYKDLSDVRVLEPGAEIPVKVITVPKTLKTPRIIAIEPTCMQYMQQGILAKIVEEIESNDTLSTLIGWTDNSPNQELARVGSSEQTLATLDLSEASDRVSNQHVRLLLRNHPHLLDGVDSCRSRKADVPGHGVKRLAKFASMGSALTFPFESMVFLTIVLLGIERERSRPLTMKDVKSLIGQVRIFGDDIIVPVDMVESVNLTLETFGFRVNQNKSFWTGKFRESCGKEYYDGHDVSIVRLRSVFPTDRSCGGEIVKTIEFRNHLYEAGLWGSTALLDKMIEKLVPFPRVLATSPVHGRRSFLGYDVEREDPILHRPLVKGLVVSPRIPLSELDGRPALLKVFTLRQELPIPDVRHLSHAGRPHSVNTKVRWTTPY
jgi:hypothetical protein